MGLAGRYQPSFADRGAGIAFAQTSCVESWPNLLRTISGNRPDVEPVSLRQGNRLPRLRQWSKFRQQNDSRSQQAENRQGCERFDHWGLLTVAVSRSRTLGDT